MALVHLCRRAVLAAPLAAIPFSRPITGVAASDSFTTFLNGIRREALARGISAGTVDRALRAARYLPHVIELDRRQPEHVLSFAEYLAKAVSPERQQEARRHLADFRPLLERIWRQYRVEPRLVVALWGVESDFGKITGNYPVVDSLATLGFDGRRSSYFRAELIAALRILDHGDIAQSRMLGSWAGAMGQCQFMPSTFLGYAVDYDGTGRRDIWSNHADVLASIANFIGRLGWRDGESWGVEVLVPDGFDTARIGPDITRSNGEWTRLGLRTTDEQALPDPGRASALIMPDGPGGRAFVVYNNFRTIMRWNKSTYFAAAVGFLVDSMDRG